MESQTYFKNMRIAPDKYRDVVRLVRGKRPTEAVNLLEAVNKKAARSLRKIILSALSNATSTLNVSADMLQFKLFTVEEGNRLKRYRAVSRGMARAFYRRMSHVKIILVPSENAVVSPGAKNTGKPARAKNDADQSKISHKARTKTEESKIKAEKDPEAATASADKNKTKVIESK